MNLVSIAFQEDPMSLKMQQHLMMKQHLRMTQQLQQAIKLLQLSKMELVSQIQQELTENPTLEETPDDPQVEPVPEAGMNSENQQDIVPDRPEGDRHELTREGGGSGEEIDWAAYLEYYQTHTPLPQNSYKGMITEELPSYEATLSAPESLTEHLLWQVRLSRLDDMEQEIAAELIGNLDEHGYLKGVELAELAVKYEVDEGLVEYVLETIQEMDPIGVAARDLRECLTIQAELIHPDDQVVYDIIQDHIPHLERKNYDAIVKAQKIPLEEVFRAAKVISLMDPRPGRKFTTEKPQYITPDIYVIKMGDDYRVTLNEDGLPKLRVSPFYSQMVRKTSGKEANNYIRDKLAGARWLIRSIHQRQRTIHRVTEAIVERQREFLDLGVNYLKPMVLKDIAEETGLHESTISRVTNKKYVHTPQGTFELKYFFNSRITRTTGDDLASESVKERIKVIIADEDPKKPHSDQKIVQLLKQQNIKIARRTVAKYREALGILSSTQRKSYF